MKFYAPTKLGETRSRTPEGFLLCEGVTIGRTGTMLYGADEVPVEAGPDGMVRIERNSLELFRPETLASINGKPFTNDHPDDDVGPENWRDLSCGVWLHPRRGEGTMDDHLLADLLITDAAMIREVDAGKIEISLGYDAEYVQTAPGRGRQRNIIVNHGALVDKGRCGPSCAIGDQAPMTTTTKKPRTVRDYISQLLSSTKDAAFLDEEMGGLEGRTDGVGGVTVNVNGSGTPATSTGDEEDPNEERFKKVEDTLANIGKVLDKLTKARDADPDDEDEDDEKRTADEESGEEEEGKSERTGDASIRAVAAAAEILSPGFKMLTIDAKGDKKRIRDRLHKCKCRALDTAYKTEAGRDAIDVFTAGKSDFEAMARATIDAAFIGASAMIGAENNGAFASIVARPQPAKTGDANPTSLAATAKSMKDFWKGRESPNGFAQ